MRIVWATLATLVLAVPAAAQVPAGLAELEMNRSRACVDILSRLQVLDTELAPLAERAQRLLGAAEAVALEDDRVVEELDPSDPVEAQVRDWFAADQELAQRYVATLAQELIDQRAAAREAIEQLLTDELTSIQAQADSMIVASDNLPAQAGPCDGAIYVRSAVEEACATSSGLICDQVALPASEVTQFRFVDSAESVWDVTELRPWTDPTPIAVTPNGQLDGARTIGYARTGNIVVSVSFSPLIVERAELTPEEAQAFQATNDSLGIVFDHAEVTFVPALGLRATLPEPLEDESSYLLHFGSVAEADVLWRGPAATGAPLEASIELGATQVTRLGAGDPISLTAIREGAGGTEPVFSIELNAVNQGRASQALLGYMTQQLGADLTQLIRPRGGE